MSATWAELTLSAGKLERRTPRLVATTGDDGWFAICNVPPSGTVALTAARGADSTDVLEVTMPPGGVLRRALGFYPERRPVDVVEGAAPVRVQMATLKAVLDAVKVTARYNEARAGFAERRRGGAGRYMTADDVMKHAPVWTTDLFRRTPGLRVVDGAVKMRGPFGDCSPALYLDGHYFDTVETFGLDGFVSPQRIAGIEVYTDASAPAQFRRLPGAAGEEAAPCGSIVIWTK